MLPHTWRCCILLLGLLALAAHAAAQSPDDDARDLRRTLNIQCREWTGAVLLRNADGSTETAEAVYSLARAADGFEGALTVNGARIPIRMEFTPDGVLSGRFGNAAYRAVLPRNIAGKPKDRTILWVGDAGAFQTLMDEEAFDLTFSGDIPLPPAMQGRQAIWTTAELSRAGFRIVLGRFSITLMECLGLFATMFFTSRFIIQWIASERAKRSVMPEVFWWVSVIGSGLMIIYPIYYGRLSVLLGHVTGWIVYIRNIWLIERHKRSIRAGEGDVTIAK